MTRIGESLDLPSGLRLDNRLAKAAMTEGLADPWNRATAAHARLYRRWAAGGAVLEGTRVRSEVCDRSGRPCGAAPPRSRHRPPGLVPIPGPPPSRVRASGHGCSRSP